MIPEMYTCIAVSTAHLSENDKDWLENAGDNMVMSRDTGFFVKLYADEDGHPPVNEILMENLSHHLKLLLTVARTMGARMVEFDSDAPCLNGFQIYEESI